MGNTNGMRKYQGKANVSKHGRCIRYQRRVTVSREGEGVKGGWQQQGGWNGSRTEREDILGGGWITRDGECDKGRAGRQGMT